MRLLVLALVACGSAPSTSEPTPAEKVRDAILTVNGHVIVIKAENFAEYREVLAAAAGFDSQVVAAGPMLFAEANLLTRTTGAPILLKGVSKGHTALRSDFAKYLVEGSLDTQLADAMPIAIGKDLAAKLNVKLGDRLEIDLVDRINERPRGAAQITALFRTGFGDYDSVLVLTTFEGVQGLLGKGDIAMGIELKLENFTEASRVAGSLGKKLGPSYKVVDWCELNRAYFKCVDSRQ